MLSSSSVWLLCYATNWAIMFILVLCQAFFSSDSPALLTLQQTPVSGDLSLQFHLGVEELAVTLTLGDQSHPHLLQLSLQAADHLGEVLQSAGVQLLCVLQGGLQAFLLNSESHSTVNVTQRVEANATVCEIMDKALLSS